jgi:streptogramin lyase
MPRGIELMSCIRELVVATLRRRSAGRHSRRRRFWPEPLEGRRLPATFTAYPLPSTALPPASITAGPDGNLWFTEPLNGGLSEVGTITPAGLITIYPFRDPSGSEGLPHQIAAGADGNLWIDCQHRIARVTTSGQVQFFPVPGIPNNGIRQLGGITSGPDGNVWFTVTDPSAPAIGKVTPSGQFTQYTTSSATAPANITTGPDGNLWFTYISGDGIGKVTTTGAITGYPFSNSASTSRTLGGITAGPDGNVWFVETVASRGTNELEVGMITPAGQITEYPLASGSNALSSGGSITTGGDGNLYLTENDQIGQVVLSSSGAPGFQEFANPGASFLGAQREGLAKGSDGNLWYTQPSPSAIVKFSTGVASPTPTPTTTTTTTPTRTPTSTPTTTPTPTPTPTAMTPTATTPTTTLTPATRPLPGFAPPRINSVTTLGRRGHIRAIRLFFDTLDPATLQPRDPLNVANASNVSHYVVTAAVRSRRSLASTAQDVPLASATCGQTRAGADEVTLALARPISSRDHLVLQVVSSTSAIDGVHAIPLDGDSDGLPGGNYVARLN